MDRRVGSLAVGVAVEVYAATLRQHLGEVLLHRDHEADEDELGQEAGPDLALERREHQRDLPLGVVARRLCECDQPDAEVVDFVELGELVPVAGERKVGDAHVHNAHAGGHDALGERVSLSAGCDDHLLGHLDLHNREP